MELSVRHIRFGDGERYMLLVDQSGMPIYFPSLYITVIIRGSSKATNTIQNVLHAIKALYGWQDYYKLNLESSFACGELLEAHQIHALRDFMQRSLTNNAQPEQKVISLTAQKRKGKTVSTKVQYARLSVVADYLGFLAVQLQNGSEENKKRIQAMVNMIKANRPKISNKSQMDRDDIHLDDELLDRLDNALKPGSKNNPVKDYGTQIRNALMIVILRVTGMRRGELLNLKVTDIDFSSNRLSIVRRPDAQSDLRSYQPVAKTRERTIPLDPLLADRIYDYVLKYRSKVSGAKKHGYLFVTHKAGPSCGHPLSIAGFSKLMHEIKGIDSEFNKIHPHAFRHAWNYEFSKRIDEKGVTPERERQLRSYLMGWNPTSDTAATYNKRHIKEKAGEVVLGLQERYLNKGDEA
ncbi:site-specific integrase [Crenobacter caeni]|uniref:Site-specific integrase n=1 Tax=Crenobacter caeni TaxID=2705474 RepID=A0A6B2KRY4_9NEIS|nr:site-specific integrase [Crenobacter caeni]NDV13005.1 site-specific integrase [Crenobacter caeni]